MKPKSPKTFEQLKSEWYGKLKKSGFDDIEYGYGADAILKRHHSLRFSQIVPAYTFGDKVIGHDRINASRAAEAYIESSTEYYRYAGFFLNDYKFETEFERMVWEGHSQGKTIREIVKYIKIQAPKLPKLFKMNRTESISSAIHKNRVQKVIKDLSKKMKDLYINNPQRREESDEG